MATIAKMTVSSVTEHGGGSIMYPCQAHRHMSHWPPTDGIYTNSTQDMEEHVKDCERCFALQLKGEGGKIATGVYVSGKSQENVELIAVSSTGDDDPNRTWAKYTPAGSLEMTITNPDAWGAFKIGRDYYVECREVVPQRSPKSDGA